jgi:hypothetical protein
LVTVFLLMSEGRHGCCCWWVRGGAMDDGWWVRSVAEDGKESGFEMAGRKMYWFLRENVKWPLTKTSMTMTGCKASNFCTTMTVPCE